MISTSDAENMVAEETRRWEAENARLRARLADVEAERDEARAAEDHWHRFCDKLLEQEKHREARLAEVEAALRPFSTRIDEVERFFRPDVKDIAIVPLAVTVGDLRRARAALDPARKETP